MRIEHARDRAAYMQRTLRVACATKGQQYPAHTHLMGLLIRFWVIRMGDIAGTRCWVKRIRRR
ncbi:hypothetical protein AA15973_2617 [Komagataeibacter sucrofermentans DSM 15973]|nr:hypothetical protein AA15973_2617 [Komagataeibacter sucrofermentans DSM 15973]